MITHCTAILFYDSRIYLLAGDMVMTSPREIWREIENQQHTKHSNHSIYYLSHFAAAKYALCFIYANTSVNIIYEQVQELL